MKSASFPKTNPKSRRMLARVVRTERKLFGNKIATKRYKAGTSRNIVNNIHRNGVR